MTARKTTTKTRAKKTTTRTASATAAAVETAPTTEGKKRRSATPRKRRGTATSVPSAEPVLTASAPAFGHAHIAHEAFLIWEASGRPHGQELSHWLEAEKRLSAAATRAA